MIEFNLTNRTMRRAFFFLVLIFIINIPGLYYGWYLKWEWFDATLHFLGGFFVAMFMAEYLKDRLVPTGKVKNTLIVIGATVFIGVVWEFSEYIANQTLIEPFYRWLEIRAYFMGDLPDTVNDLLMDILGANSFSFLHLFWRREPQKLNSLQSLDSEQS